MSVRPVGVATLGLITGLLFGLGPVTVDLSLPSLPALQHALGSGGARVELTLTLLFFGLALTQLLYGAVADRFGRRWPLLLGLMAYSAASLLGAAANSVTLLSVARAGQALGYGVVIVLIRSAVADLCDERATARVFSIAITVMSATAVATPAIGGLLVDHLGWRAVFVTMAAVGLVSLFLTAVILPETHPPQRRSHNSLRGSLGRYAQIFLNARFAAFSLVCAGAVACQFSYNTGGPALLIEHYGLSTATAGMLLSLIALSTALAAQINVFLLRFVPTERVMLTAVVVLVIASAALLLMLAGHIGDVTAVVAVLFVAVATPGFIVANAMAAAISSAGARAGAASALVGVLQFLLGTLGSGLVGYFHDPSGVVLAVVMLVLSGSALAIAVKLRHVGLSAPTAAG